MSYTHKIIMFSEPKGGGTAYVVMRPGGNVDPEDPKSNGEQIDIGSISITSLVVEIGSWRFFRKNEPFSIDFSHPGVLEEVKIEGKSDLYLEAIK